MKYGCIGERLGHSFSKEIHNKIADYPYELFEVARDELDAFATKRDFIAINVTIPYKELIMPHLYYIDEHAKLIGAVNTVVNRDGRLYGYNTDFFGMSALLAHAGISVKGKKVAILGSGGTSKTSFAVCRALGARETVKVSRTASDDAIDYKALTSEHTDIEIIINTTPVGMFPNNEGVPVDLSVFPRLSGVVDAVYNPLRTKLIREAKRRGIPAEGGLYMLVAQAVRASEIFLDKKYDDALIERVYSDIVREKENIVLIGMPASGKSTVGKLLASLTSRPFVDTDEVIASEEGSKVPEIFAEHGEGYFREKEAEVAMRFSEKNGQILATGGGIVLNPDNVDRLSQNGRIFFIDRPLADLVPTSDRPLSSTKEAIEARYKERYPLYVSAADKIIDASADALTVANTVLGEFEK
ncbi:MAG: shikimate dehydrogenase [Clostridia bacterium]|nr:shikimate dehydrogenase [Clostridia bacterium]